MTRRWLPSTKAQSWRSPTSSNTLSFNTNGACRSGGSKRRAAFRRGMSVGDVAESTSVKHHPRALGSSVMSSTYRSRLNGEPDQQSLDRTRARMLATDWNRLRWWLIVPWLGMESCSIPKKLCSCTPPLAFLPLYFDAGHYFSYIFFKISSCCFIPSSQKKDLYSTLPF